MTQVVITIIPLATTGLFAIIPSMIERERIIRVSQPEKMPRPLFPQIPPEYRQIHRDVMRQLVNELIVDGISPRRRQILQSFKAENALLTYVYYVEQPSTAKVQDLTCTLHISSSLIREQLSWVYDHGATIWDTYYEKYARVRAERDTRYKDKRTVRQPIEKPPGLSSQLAKDPQIVELVKTLRARGATTENIAEELHVTEGIAQEIIKVLLNNGLFPKLRTKYTFEEIESFRQEIARLRMQNLSDRQIGKHLGIDPKTVRRIMKS